MEAKSVSIKEIAKDNPTFCLSALRALRKCHKCKTYIDAYNHDKIEKLKCNPKLKKEAVELLKQKRLALNAKHGTEKQIDILNKLLEEV